MRPVLLFFLFSFSVTFAQAQLKRALFLGNSYTYVNELPRMVADVASSAGDSVFFDSNAMGGATFYAHSINTVSLDKIKLGNWDYVVLQGQSTELFGYFTGVTFPTPEVAKLDSMINQYNSCGETMFFMTWGRKNGFGTYSYETMDSLIHENYMRMAAGTNAVVSPVSAVWKYIRQNYPSIELYDPDESHPSFAGTYAAACCFYSALFRKDPEACTFNSVLLPTDAANIRTAAKAIVYDHLRDWHIGEYDSLFITAHCPGFEEEENEEQAWNIYPNPASTTITFEIENKNDATIFLYNSLGAVVREIKTTSKTISIADLPEGLYFLRQQGESRGRKFIKQ
jgi:hypothetical protein